MREENQPIHVVPVEDLIEHITDGGDCPCGPVMEPVLRDDGSMGWLVTHSALDGREHNEEDHDKAACPFCSTSSFTCPVCGMTSFNPNDVKYGYCGNCCKFTGEPQ